MWVAWWDLQQFQRFLTGAPRLASVWLLCSGIGAALVAFGAYLGLFAWANDGLIAGVRLFGTSAAFGGGLAITGAAFRFAAAAHARGGPRRWWIQLLVVLIGYVAFGLAVWSSSLLDRVERT